MLRNDRPVYLILGVLALLAIFTVTALHGCTTAPSSPPAQEQKEEPPSDPGSWKYAYLVQDAITDRMLHWSGWARACPKFEDMEYAERKTALIAILGGIAQAESGQKLAPKPYREPNQGVDKVTGLPTYSEGLYQLSYKDAVHVHYKAIPICASISYPKKNITDGRINAGCAVAIMDNIISRGGDVKAYWSSFNPDRPGFKTTVATTKKIYPECF